MHYLAACVLLTGLTAAQSLIEQTSNLKVITKSSATKILLLQYREYGAEKSLITVAEATTATNGEVILRNLPKGKYFLVALPNPDAKSNAVMTFYPGSTDFEGALPIEVQASDPKAEVILELAQSNFYRISGKLTSGGKQSGDLPRAIEFVRLAGRDGAMIFTSGTPLQLNRASVLLRPDGTYQSPPMPPGSYQVTAMVKGSVVKLGVIRLPQKHLEGVIFDFPEFLEVSGKLIYEGREPTDQLPRILNLIDTEEDSKTLITMVNESGDFKIPKALAGHYRVVIANNKGLYVKAVDQNPGKDLTLIGGTEQKMVVTIAKSKATIAGTTTEPLSIVSITPIKLDRLAAIERSFAFTDSNKKGEFDTPTMAPGDYRACAWSPKVDRENVMKAIPDSSSTPLLESRCATVRLKEKSQTRVNLKSIHPSELDKN